MYDKVDLAPLLTKFGKNSFQLWLVLNVTGKNDFGSKALGQGADPFFKGFIHIGKSYFSTSLMQLLGNPPCNTLVICEADDNATLTSHQSHVFHSC